MFYDPSGSLESTMLGASFLKILKLYLFGKYMYSTCTCTVSYNFGLGNSLKNHFFRSNRFYLRSSMVSICGVEDENLGT